MGHRKLGVKSAHRRALLRSQVTSLFKHGRIMTTEPRAKEVRAVAEKMITLAKRGDLAARRQVLAFVWEEPVVRKLFDTIAPKYDERAGGYTRIVRVGHRRGDAAPLVMLELL